MLPLLKNIEADGRRPVEPIIKVILASLKITKRSECNSADKEFSLLDIEKSNLLISKTRWKNR